MHSDHNLPGIESHQKEKAAAEGAGTKPEQLLPWFWQVGDQQVHGEMAAGFDPDTCSQKGYENTKVSPQFFIPGEAVVKKIPGENLDETDQGKPQNSPDKDRVFYSVYPVGHPTGVF
jgi:hypothetical protein